MKLPGAKRLGDDRRPGEPARGQALLAKRHTEVMPVTRFTTAHSRDRGESVWAPEYQLVDELVVPLLRVIGKA